MADRVKKVRYCAMKIPRRPGQGAKVLEALREADIGLLAFTGFPDTGGKAQIDFFSVEPMLHHRSFADDPRRIPRAQRSCRILGRCHAEIQ